ncbi:TonB family protein [Inquilinus sp. KBS0705]|nr:TonB family protein [Inquilinus sp. KBS0705]
MSGYEPSYPDFLIKLSMIRILPLLILGMLFCGEVDAQKGVMIDKKAHKQPDSVAYYMKRRDALAFDQNDAEFLRLIIKADGGMFNVEDYYMDGKLKLTARTATNDYWFWPDAEGIMTEYYPNGNKKLEKTYKKGVVVGDVNQYYPNGKLYIITSFDKGSQNYRKECRDSLGNVLANNGNGKWIEFKDDFVDYQEGQVLNGLLEGEWNVFVNGKLMETNGYKNDLPIFGKAYDDFQNKVFTKIDIAPEFPGGVAAFGKYMVKTLHYPSTAVNNNTQGRVIVTFIVEKDGSINDVKVVRGLGSGTDEEAVRVIKNMPLWKPGIFNGMPVRVQYSLPINFAIEEIQQGSSRPANHYNGLYNQ